jgi:rod shape-determining protein MreD
MTSLLPVATSVLAMLLSIEPLHILGAAVLSPALVLMASYYWTIHYPSLLPAAALFAIGMTQDLVSGGPLGVSALVLLLSRAILLKYRRHLLNRPFPILWASFALLTAAAMTLASTLHLLLAAAVLDFRAPTVSAVLTVLLFPVASFLLGQSQRALMAPG